MTAHSHRSRNLFVVAAFCIVLTAPLIAWIDGIEPQVAAGENRAPATFPEFPVGKRALKKYPGQIEAWFEDHQGLRGAALALHQSLTRDLLASHDSVLTGRQDWLFLLREPTATEARPPIVADHCGRNPFTPDELAAWVEALTANRARLAAEDRLYVLVFAPNKQSVYPDMLPGSVRCTPGPSRLDQLVAALADHPEILLVDLRPGLRARRDDPRPLWYRSDTHWNGFGASSALEIILTAINQRTESGLESALDGERFRLSHVRTTGLGLAHMLDQADRHHEINPMIAISDRTARELPNPFPQRTDNPQRQSEAYAGAPGTRERALVFHDSFFHLRLKQLAAESFASTVYVWHRGKPSLADESTVIARTDPTIVVHEMVERNLLHPYFAERDE